MRTFIIITVLACIHPGISNAVVLDKVSDIIDRLTNVTYTSYGYGDDDDNNYNNYNNDDDDNSNYNNDDDDNSHYNNDDDDNHYGGDDDDDSSEIPLDGGLSFLAVAGAGLGIKKLRDNRAKRKTEKTDE